MDYKWWSEATDTYNASLLLRITMMGYLGKDWWLVICHEKMSRSLDSCWWELWVRECMECLDMVRKRIWDSRWLCVVWASDRWESQMFSSCIYTLILVGQEVYVIWLMALVVWLWIIYITVYPRERVIIYMIRLDDINYVTWYGLYLSFWFFCENIFIRPEENLFWSEVVNIIFCLVDNFENSLLFMLSVESEKVDGINMVVVNYRM